MSSSIVRDRPHHAEAPAKIVTPAVKTLRRPRRSPSDPPVSSNAASVTAYDSTTHWMSLSDAPNADWSAGSATLTTVPSMKARLDPRIVAASTHAPRPLSLPVAAALRIAASSHGGLVIDH